MAIQFTVSPDFNACQISSWYIFNTRLGRFLEESCHLALFDGFDQLREALESDKIDIIYANAFDTAFLLREKGFLPVARASERSDEALIAVAAGSPVQKVADFKAPLKVAATSAPDVEMIGRILLEPADIDRGDVELVARPSYVNVAKAVIKGEAQAGFFLRDSFEQLSGLVRSRLRPIASSHMYVVRHAFLIRPRLAHLKGQLLEGFAAMMTNDTDKATLADLGFDGNLAPMSFEDAEFMIDLMDALLP